MNMESHIEKDVLSGLSTQERKKVVLNLIRASTVSDTKDLSNGKMMGTISFLKRVLVKGPLMATKQTTFKVGRDARDGRFETVEKARKDPSHHVVETIKRTTPKKGK